MVFKQLCVLFFACSLLSSCASYKAKYKDKDYQTFPIESNNLHTIYLVGDGGGVEMNESTGLLRHLKKELTAKKNSTILFLGDNLYPVGVPPKGTEHYDLSIYRLQVQLDMLKDFPGRIVFIPGNHDWYKYGPEGLARQEVYIDSVLSARPIMENEEQEKYFLPEQGCSGPEIITLAEGIHTVVFDSHWFLESVDRNNFDHCKYKTRAEFNAALRAALLKIKGETMVLAMHHPPFTYGEHGGYFNWLSYLFPLTQLNKGLLIPLPASGIVYSTMRPYVNVQDNKHRMNKLLVQNVLDAIAPYAPTLVVSGHEHNLQYIEEKNHYFVVSGAGSLKTACAVEESAQFCVGDQGYVRVDFKTSKLAIANYFIIKDELPELLYQKELIFN